MYSKKKKTEPNDSALNSSILPIKLFRIKISFNAIGIPNTYLNMSLFQKTRIGINWLSFKKKTSDTIIRWFFHILVHFMETLYDSTVQSTESFIILAAILGKNSSSI